MKPKGQKEVDSHGTANHLLVQDRNNEGETNGPRRFGIDGGIQSWDWVKRAYGPVSSMPWEQSGFRPLGECGELGVNVVGRREELGRFAGIKTGEVVNGINWSG